jgi:LysM repeat protein
MDQRARRSPARFLGPLALIAVIVAFLAIVSGSGSGGSSSSSTSSSTTAQTSTSSSSTSKKKSSTAKTHTSTTPSGASVYIVKVGDTLGGIAAKTGVPLSTIQTLNPNVDPHAMIAGQHIRLK